jgi:hypothetical protein
MRATPAGAAGKTAANESARQPGSARRSRVSIEIGRAPPRLAGGSGERGRQDAAGPRRARRPQARGRILCARSLLRSSCERPRVVSCANLSLSVGRPAAATTAAALHSQLAGCLRLSSRPICARSAEPRVARRRRRRRPWRSGDALPARANQRRRSGRCCTWPRRGSGVCLCECRHSRLLLSLSWWSASMSLLLLALLLLPAVMSLLFWPPIDCCPRPSASGPARPAGASQPALAAAAARGGRASCAHAARPILAAPHSIGVFVRRRRADEKSSWPPGGTQISSTIVEFVCFYLSGSAATQYSSRAAWRRAERLC